MMSYNTTDTQPSQSVNAWQKTIVPSPLEAPQKQRGRRSTADERKRAVRACDQCRRVKEKCEGGIPCRRCLHFSRPCEFNSISSHSNDLNSSPGGSSASNALLRDQRHRLLRDRARYMERILKHEIKGISLDTDSLRVRAEAIPEDGFRGESSAAPKDSSSEELAIEDETCTIDPVKGETATHYSGEFSYWNFSMRIKRQLETRVQSPREQTQGTDSTSDYVRAGQLQSSANNLSIAISCCPPRPIADFLVRIFFEFAETYYFYVAKSWLLTKLDLIYDNPEILTSKDVGTVGIILTVFAIGTQYAYLDSPTQNVRGHPGSKYSEDEIGTMFYQQAIRLLPEIIESSTLESVQACLLFGVYALPIDASGLGYIYVNLALRLGMQNGMHRKYTGNALSDVMIETRNRVWWTACVLERKICIFHGRPLSVLQSDIDADLPKDREDLQSAGIPSNVAHMCASIYLTRKLEEYLNQMNMSRNYQKHDVPSLSARLITIKTELATWWSSLAILQEKTDQHSHPAHHRSTMHLRLEFCLIRMFVGRPFMFGGQSARLDSNSPPSVFASQAPTAANGEMRIPSRQQLVEDCVQAAKEALEICSSLCYSGHGLARGSYIEYSSCRASLLVLIGYSVQNQSNQFQTVVHDGLVMIRNMSAAGESARSEIAFIEALERSLKSRDDDNTLAPGSTNSGYDSFKHWEWIWKNGGAAHPPREGLRPETAGTVAIEPKASAATWGPFATTSNHTPYDWRTTILSETDRDNFFAMPGSDVNLAFQPNNDLALFEGGNLRLGSNGSMFARQAMNQFPENTDFDFTASGQVR